MKKQAEIKSTMFWGAAARFFQYARVNREKATIAERILWERLRNKQIVGAKFRRQHALGNFILDFYCQAALLAIEVDGKYHLDPIQAEYDQNRTAVIKKANIKLIRFSNDEVLNNIEQVISTIIICLQEQKV
ncbi:MAG: endonuclease domain-containing protein [Saprospiraceae bacterium]